MSHAALTPHVDGNQRSGRPDRGRERWPDPLEVLEALGVEPGTSLAEVCPADGYFALAAADLVAPAPVYAVDVDGTVLDELDVLAIERGIENLATVSGLPGDLADRLPDRVDAVLIAGGFHEVDSTGSLAEQAWRSLRPGGRFLVVDWRTRPEEGTAGDGESPGPPEAYRRTSEETRLAVAPAGFELAAEVDIPPHHYGLIFERAHDR